MLSDHDFKAIRVQDLVYALPVGIINEAASDKHNGVRQFSNALHVE